MLARFPAGLDIRELRLLGIVLLGLALVAIFVVPAVGAFALIDKTHRVLSVACGILAGSAAYEPLQRLRATPERAGRAGTWAVALGVLVFLVGVALRDRLPPAQRPLYEACVAALFVVATIVADRMRSLARGGR